MKSAQVVRDLGKVALHTARLCLPKPCAARVDLTGKNVIVTGASPNSLGFETVCELVRWGANVVADDAGLTGGRGPTHAAATRRV